MRVRNEGVARAAGAAGAVARTGMRFSNRLKIHLD